LSEILHIYTRVSTVVQADEGMSLDIQRDLGIKRASELGFEHKLWNEGGKSSNHEEIDKRPVLSQLFNEIRQGVVKHLFVYDQSRLSRNDTVSSIFRIECAKQGVTLYNKEGKYNLSDHNDHFMKQILDAVGQFDNAQRAERTRLGKVARVRQGNWLGGPPPYGYELKNRKLVINEDEAKWVRYVFDQYSQKVPLIDVKFELDRNGVQPRRQKGTWTMGSLQAMMRNTHYIGYWDFRDGKTGEEIRVECPRILSSDLWSKVQKTKEDHLSKRNSTNAVKHFYMLKNVLRCGHCGTWLSGVINPKQPSKAHYYCPKKERQWAKKEIPESEKWQRGRVCSMTRSLGIAATDELVWDTVVELITKSRSFRELTKVEILGKDYTSLKGSEEEAKDSNQKIKSLKKTHKKIEEALAKVETDRLMDRISSVQYPIIRENLTKEMLEVEVQIERLTDKVESLGNDKRFYKWFDDFKKKIASFKSFTREQKREVLLGLLAAVDVFMIDSQTHWLEIQFHIPLVGDELVYNDPNNKKLGYAIRNGQESFMVQLGQKSHSKKKP
jgi:DNA invertase Pin-like site-specific DNA recombinase